MVDKRSYYDVLGVARSATEEEIRRAFRKRALEWHPDRNQSKEAAERFKEFNEAYQALIDPAKRSVYDRYGRVDVGPNGGRGFDGSDFSGGFGDIFDAFFGGFGGRRDSGPQRGQDLHFGIEIEFREAARGVTKEVIVNRTELCSACSGSRTAPGTELATCNNCQGSGQIRRSHSSFFGQFTQIVNCSVCQGQGRVVQTPCPACKGAGRERCPRTLSVHVPAGIDDGMQIRLEGEGEAGGRAGLAGDLYLTISVQPHPLFRRDKANLVLDLPVNLAQAALGTEVEIPMLDDSVEVVAVPAGVQAGTVLRVKQKGLANLTNGRQGDLLVCVQVVTPEHLGPQARKLLEELADVLEEESAAVNGHKSWIDKLKEAIKGDGG